MKSFLAILRRPANVPTLPSGPESVTLDIVGRLPIELQLSILDYLESDDIEAAINTCRSWRNAWLSDEIWPRLAHRLFPGLEHHIRRSATDSEDTGDAFRRVLHKIQARQSGRFTFALHHEIRLDPEHFFTSSKHVPVLEGGVHPHALLNPSYNRPGNENSRFMLYNNGRIAWWPDNFLPYFAIVDDIRTRRRRGYMFPRPDGELRGFKTSMSDKLLLLGHKRILHAWHLELDRLCSTEVPGNIVRCVAEGETVLIISKNAELFQWSFGHEPQLIDTSGCYEKGPLETADVYDFFSTDFSYSNAGSKLVNNGTLVDFILHPTDDNIVFVITLSRGPASQEVRVYEIRHGQLAETYCLSLDRNKWPILREIVSGFINLRWEKVDSYGGYCLTQITHVPPWDPTIPSESTSLPCDGFHSLAIHRRPCLIAVCFNIYTKSLSISYYHHTGLKHQESTCKIWNSRLVTTHRFTLQGSLLSLPSCNLLRSYDKTNPTPFYSTVTSRHNGLSRRKREDPGALGLELEFHNADFAFDPYQHTKMAAISNDFQHRSLKVVGDDDFLILINETLYSVWGFEDDLPEKMIQGGRSLWRTFIY
ncbi:uncharacterized protein GGS25DRAFT_83033 [Hypoxylon fragiforme]|uniref:uncharacterized protein n=1 Tax=Hypoxylon fragiforme TaxID=63214 RepID=UPI0020C6CE1C|nr:uncharacterized protein GGS25DRAFT_83033 [Hypoxylon fragiforme]KAI2603197.1 hypothetical protein GGS25DRAFT_83033 [Hypoxylon fragiforme]